jgi:hypothetical protein
MQNAPLERFISHSPRSRWGSRLLHLAVNRHKGRIGSQFHLGGAKFSYLGQDLEEALGEPEETIARMTVWETAAEHLHDVLSGD